MRQKSHFLSHFNAITFVQSSQEKHSALRFPQISRTLARIPPREEGRFAIVTNVEAGSGGRETSQRGFTPTNDVFADGQAAWSWRPKAGVKSAKMLTRLAGDGDNNVWFTGESAE